MAKLSVTFADAEKAVIGVLATALGAGIVSTDYPSARLTGTVKKVQVDQEPSDISGYPILERTPVRVVIHTAPEKRSDAKSYASTVLAALSSYRGSSTVAAIVPILGRSEVSIDQATGNHMCWVLVRVDIKATQA